MSATTIAMQAHERWVVVIGDGQTNPMFFVERSDIGALWLTDDPDRALKYGISVAAWAEVARMDKLGKDAIAMPLSVAKRRAA